MARLARSQRSFIPLMHVRRVTGAPLPLLDLGHLAEHCGDTRAWTPASTLTGLSTRSTFFERVRTASHGIDSVCLSSGGGSVGAMTQRDMRADLVVCENRGAREERGVTVLTEDSAPFVDE